MKRLCSLVVIAGLLVSGIFSCAPAMVPTELDTFSDSYTVEEYVLSTGISYRTFSEETYDCENFALDLANQAVKDRKPIGSLLILEFEGDELLDTVHIQNFAIVGNRYVFIEPQTGEVSPYWEGWSVFLD